MAKDTRDIGAFEAKTHLAELLRETERGASFAIRRRGKIVARLVPPDREAPGESPAEILTLFRQVRQRVRGSVKVRALIEEGRRF